jgi:hypothetical protein
MKKFSFLLVCMSLFLIGCGGNSTGARIASPVTGPAADTALAAEAVSDSPWSSETVSTPTDAQKTSATSNVQALVTSIIATEESSKKSKSSTRTINRSVVGPNGGGATATGTMEITTTPVTGYPITTATEATITIDGYLGVNYSLHGSTEYSGSTTITSAGNFETKFTTHGGYSYKDANGVYSLATQMDVTLTSVNGVYSGTYTYVVNDKTFTGSF